LDFARLENGDVTLHLTAVEVGPFVRNVLELLQPKCVDSNVRCLTPVGPEGVEVWADLDALRQVLFNLIGNAITFNVPHGSVQLSWSVEHDQVAIHVHDTGPGLTRDQLDVIFEPFVRVTPEPYSATPHAVATEHGMDHGAEHRPEGSGLGLPISRALVEAMHGSLTAESVPEHGSTFSLRLPRPHVFH